jgi:hypothetical protein
MTEQPRRRPWFWAGAVGAAIVATIFATIGDGVDVQAPGWRGLVVDHAHTAVWVLLAGAAGVAALQGRWSRTAGGLATAALALYVVFLLVVLTG